LVINLPLDEIPLRSVDQPTSEECSFQTVLPPRKDRTLRVYASDDPAVRHFKWPLADPAAAGLHAFRGRVDIADIEVIKPVLK
jgi:hypothetical protein